MKNEKLVYKTFSKTNSEKRYSFSQFCIYRNKLNKLESFVISKGKFDKRKTVTVRVLSKQITKTSLFQNIEVKKNMKLLSKYKNFLLVIINNDTHAKNYSTDVTLRYYGLGAQIIKDYKVRNMVLLSRTKKKIIGLEGFGLKIKKQIIIKWKRF